MEEAMCDCCKEHTRPVKIIPVEQTKEPQKDPKKDQFESADPQAE